MRKRLTALLTVLMLFISVSAYALPVEVYYIDPCGGCKEGGCGKCYLERDLFYRFTTLLKGTDAELEMKNISKNTALYDERNERVLSTGITDIDTVKFPTVFIGDAMFLGDGSQNEDILAYIESGYQDYSGYTAMVEKHEEEHSDEYRLIYMYIPDCQPCVKMDRYLRSYLPSWLHCEKVSLAEVDGIRWQIALMERFGLDDDSFFAPAVFYGDKLFVGTNEIYLGLTSYIGENQYMTTPGIEEIEHDLQ